MYFNEFSNKKEILFIKEQYEQVLKEEKEISNRKRCLENILLTICPHEEKDFGFDRIEKWCICKLCGLNVLYLD